jgi:hypothetical protein
MHTIRLRGPWEFEALKRFVPQQDGTYRPDDRALPAPARATMPADWSEPFGRDFLGRVRYRRIFQKPTGLDSGERVFLVVEPPLSQGVVGLNHTPLGDVKDSTGRFDITQLLDDHNHLEIVVSHPALDAAGMADDDSSIQLAGGLVGEVRLEIEE